MLHSPRLALIESHREAAVSKEPSRVFSSSSVQRKPQMEVSGEPLRERVTFIVPAAAGVPEKSKLKKEATVSGDTEAEREPRMHAAGVA